MSLRPSAPQGANELRRGAAGDDTSAKRMPANAVVVGGVANAMNASATARKTDVSMFCPHLFDGTARAPLQSCVQEVRILFELLGFLLIAFGNVESGFFTNPL